jgi:hypothetical protein
MKYTNKYLLSTAASLLMLTTSAFAGGVVSDDMIAGQRAALAANTAGLGFGPQSPRDIDTLAGTNGRAFSDAPAFTAMNLCNIHFHENAEHKGGQFGRYAGNGDGKGKGTGFVFSGELTDAELTPVDMVIGDGKYGNLQSGGCTTCTQLPRSSPTRPLVLA